MMGEREEEEMKLGLGGREGGRRVTAIGGVVDCFSYKSGIADRSPYQTRGFSELCVSVTGTTAGGWASLQLIDCPSISSFSVLICVLCLTLTLSLTLFTLFISLNNFASIRVQLLKDSLRNNG